jgi:hypothetical protein
MALPQRFLVTSSSARAAAGATGPGGKVSLVALQSRPARADEDNQLWVRDIPWRRLFGVRARPPAKFGPLGLWRWPIVRAVS